MAALSEQQFETWRGLIQDKILQAYNSTGGSTTLFYITCLGQNLLNCHCVLQPSMQEAQLSFCPLPGKMDYFYVSQPFCTLYGFKVKWHCKSCNSEMACGIETN